MTYQVPASQASINQNRFEFTLPGSKKKYSIPQLRFLKPSLMRELDSSANKIDRVYMLLEHYHPNLIDEFDGLDQVEAFYTAWAAASGITVGESSDSSE
ncbi:hypothetical protein [Microbacterium aurantiacum]|uniref:hypothetical protein n=1 Tax=Microbacterium aurantiacum TaxID=162393 RepID=UPI003440CA8C